MLLSVFPSHVKRDFSPPGQEKVRERNEKRMLAFRRRSRPAPQNPQLRDAARPEPRREKSFSDLSASHQTRLTRNAAEKVVDTYRTASDRGIPIEGIEARVNRRLNLDSEQGKRISAEGTDN